MALGGGLVPSPAVLQTPRRSLAGPVRIPDVGRRRAWRLVRGAEGSFCGCYFQRAGAEKAKAPPASGVRSIEPDASPGPRGGRRR